MTWQEFLAKLVQTPALWVAVVGLYHFFITWLAPTFPKEGLVAIDSVVLVIASVVTGTVVGAYIYAKKLLGK